MGDKQDRQRMLRQLVRDHTISNQEELSALMKQRGFNVAQATLSRDIREMRIYKAHDEAGYFYRLPSPDAEIRQTTGLRQVDSIISLEFSGSLAVIRTRPGHANMIASILDGMKSKEIMGTLAGDDTILLVLREGHPYSEIEQILDGIFPGVKDKCISK